MSNSNLSKENQGESKGDLCILLGVFKCLAPTPCKSRPPQPTCPLPGYQPKQQFLHFTVHLCNRSLRTLVGKVHRLAFEAVARAENNSAVVLEDGEILKGVVGKPDRLTIFPQVCADINLEFELHSTAERSR
jgi:hypothetical protein